MILSAHRIVLALLLLCILSGMSAVSDATPRLPSPKRECALCHVMWLTEFKRKDVTPLIPYEPRPVVETGRQDVVSTERMCLSCHDGFVLDSRFLWKQKKHSHPVGKKPSSAVTIPLIDGKNLFPLNDDGKLYCGTCHTAHGVDWESTESPVFMRRPTRDGTFCQSCHKDKAQGASAGFHPVNKPVDGHPALLDSSRARLSTSGKIICQSCHTPHAAPGKKLLVMHNERSQLCGSCHSDRAARDAVDAARLHTHPVNVVPREARVPETLVKKGSRKGPGGTLICQTCHKPHKATPATKLLVASNRNSSLCVSCHRNQRRVEGGKHDMRLLPEGRRKSAGGTDLEGGACGACHVPHAGKGPKMWARKLAKGGDPMAATCLSCHSKGGIAGKHTPGPYSHPVGVDVARLGHRVALPTFTSLGIKLTNSNRGVVTCASCHNPHQWDPAHPDKSAKPGTPGDASNSFLRKANVGDNALCKSCHKDKWLVKGTDHDMTKMAPDSRNRTGQAPRRAGVCGSCHLAHKGRGRPMWARDLPAGSNPLSAPCLSCHQPASPGEKKLPGEHSHPVDVSVSTLGIQTTDNKWSRKRPPPAESEKPVALPLFDHTGRRDSTRGKVGCATCHDPHRWSPDSTRAVSGRNPEGDVNNSFLRIADQGRSKLCINCHADKAAVSRSRHGPKKTGPGADKSDAASVCYRCHRPHEARDSFLWAREDGPGNTRDEKRCTSCHRDGGLAEKKQTGQHSHPIGVLATLNRPGKLPLYTTSGKHTDEAGKVGCGSCHDPHQWQTGNGSKRAGKDTTDVEEGDVSNSFLRVGAVHGELCSECHRDQALVRSTDHDLSITAPKSHNAHGQSPRQSGLCGSCHSVHNATASLRLWARTPGKDGNPIEGACKSCHNPRGIASAKVPARTSHPEKVTVWSEALRKGLRPASPGALPVFNRDGHPDKTGNINCATCHNPHQWNAGRTQTGPGRNTEGDTGSSFLRLSHTGSFLCADCHGLDSIYRYKYFHADKGHEKHPLTR